VPDLSELHIDEPAPPSRSVCVRGLPLTVSHCWRANLVADSFLRSASWHFARVLHCADACLCTDTPPPLALGGDTIACLVTKQSPHHAYRPTPVPILPAPYPPPTTPSQHKLHRRTSCSCMSALGALVLSLGSSWTLLLLVTPPVMSLLTHPRPPHALQRRLLCQTPCR
jgi:hypothetical protein